MICTFLLLIIYYPPSHIIVYGLTILYTQINPQYGAEELRMRQQLEMQQDAEIRRRLLMNQEQNQLARELEYRNKLHRLQELQELQVRQQRVDALRAQQREQQELDQHRERLLQAQQHEKEQHDAAHQDKIHQLKKLQELQQARQQQQQLELLSNPNRLIELQHQQHQQEQQRRDSSILASLRDEFFLKQQHEQMMNGNAMLLANNINNKRDEEDLLAMLRASGKLRGVLPGGGERDFQRQLSNDSRATSLTSQHRIANHHQQDSTDKQLEELLIKNLVRQRDLEAAAKKQATLEIEAAAKQQAANEVIEELAKQQAAISKDKMNSNVDSNAPQDPPQTDSFSHALPNKVIDALAKQQEVAKQQAAISRGKFNAPQDTLPRTNSLPASASPQPKVQFVQRPTFSVEDVLAYKKKKELADDIIKRDVLLAHEKKTSMSDDIIKRQLAAIDKELDARAAIDKELDERVTKLLASEQPPSPNMETKKKRKRPELDTLLEPVWEPPSPKIESKKKKKKRPVSKEELDNLLEPVWEKKKKAKKTSPYGNAAIVHGHNAIDFLGTKSRTEKTSRKDDDAADVILQLRHKDVSDREIQTAKKWNKQHSNTPTITYPALPPPEKIPFISPGLKYNIPSLPIEPELTDTEIANLLPPAPAPDPVLATKKKMVNGQVVSDDNSSTAPADDIVFLSTHRKISKPKRAGKGIDTWWPSNSCIRKERRKLGDKEDEEDTDEEDDVTMASMPGVSFVKAGVEAVENRLATSVEPGVLEKLPHCRLYADFCKDRRDLTLKSNSKYTPKFCCQTTETLPSEVMVCCSICSTWRHAQCGGHYKQYTAKNTDPSNLLFEPVCDQCYIEKQFIEHNPLAQKRIERQRIDHLRRVNATNAVMRQVAFGKHSGQYKWPLGNVSMSNISVHTKSVQARHEKAEKQWNEMASRLGSESKVPPRERQRVRTRELERLMHNVEEAGTFICV